MANAEHYKAVDILTYCVSLFSLRCGTVNMLSLRLKKLNLEQICRGHFEANLEKKTFTREHTCNSNVYQAELGSR